MIRRAEHSADKRFTLVSRSLAQDKSLSYQARGLLVYVLSKPPRWKSSFTDLRREGGIGRTALDNIMGELVKAGYVVRHRERDTKGKLDWIMEVFEEPQPVLADSSQCTSTSTGASARPSSVVKRALDIDSTCASAGSSVDLTDLREKEKPRPVKAYKQEPKPPEPKFLYPPPAFAINAALYVWLAENCFAFSDDELKTATQTWRESRASQPFTKTRTLAMWESDWQKFIRAYWGIRQQQKARSNGNGNGQEYTGPVKSKPNPKAENCPDCRGMGNVRFEKDGIWYAKPCKHERSGVVAA